MRNRKIYVGFDSFYCRVIKSVLDWAISFIFVLCFFWVYLIIAVAIKMDDPSGPVLFKQDRLGKNGKKYKMYKFRSMCVGAEQIGTGVYSDNNDPRVTKVGRFLRKTSLDELPQLFNVLRGELSLVGFRSPLTYHPWPWEQYTPEQRIMFEVLPGITGWAQVHGRKQLEWSKRIELNVWYAQNVSFLLDVKILFKTVMTVIRPSDNENIGTTV